jgi:hypothetical protein
VKLDFIAITAACPAVMDAQYGLLVPDEVDRLVGPDMRW